MAKLSLLLLLCLTAVSGFGQSINSYMKLRKQYAIYRAINVSGLDNFVGTRYVELKGTVKGSFKAKGVATILLEDYEGQTVEIDCPDGGEDWMLGGEVSTRMIVKATRASVGEGVRKTMIAAAPEADVARRENEQIRSAPTSGTKRGSKGSLNPLTTKYAYVKPPSEVIPVYANFIRKWNKRVSQSQSLHIANAVIGYSLRYGVDARLIMAILMAESDFNIGEHSHAGAMGLGQLMPVNAQELGISNAYDIYQNLYGTVVLVRGHLEKHQNKTNGNDVRRLARELAGYNAGDGAVKRYGGIPPYRETQNYVRKVINYYRWLRGA